MRDERKIENKNGKKNDFFWIFFLSLCTTKKKKESNGNENVRVRVRVFRFIMYVPVPFAPSHLLSALRYTTIRIAIVLDYTAQTLMKVSFIQP